MVQNGIVFISSNTKSKKKLFDKRQGKKTSSIMIALRGGLGVLAQPDVFAAELTTTFNEGPVTVSPSASVTIFTPDCTFDPLWPDSSFYYYIIADDAFNWGTDGPVLTVSGNGLPGVEFYSPNPLQ